MRQGQQNRRNRGRGRKQQNPLARNYESNGPDVKIRGTAQHIADKYASLARDMVASGDLVTAENYWQHAEHYIRIIMSAQTQSQAQNNSSQAREGDAANGSAANGPREASAGGDVAENADAPVEAANKNETDGASDEAPAKESSGQRRSSRRRTNGSGRKSSNGENKRGGARSKNDEDSVTAGEFAGLPPSISTLKSGGGSAESKDADDKANGDAADDAATS